MKLTYITGGRIVLPDAVVLGKALAFDAEGGKIVGVTPHFMHKLEPVSDLCTELIATETMAERKTIMEEKADAFVIVPGGIGTFDEFFQILTLRVLGRHSKPIILYNVPSRTGCNIKPETYAKLADIPNIVAIKEANGDISSVVKTRLLCGDKLDIYSGNDDQIIPIMSLGGKGVISVLSNVMPKETVEMCDKMLKGDLEGAAKMQIEFSSLIDALFIEVNPIPAKTAMNLMGMNMGPLRLPMTEMEDGTKAVLTNELKKFNLI